MSVGIDELQKAIDVSNRRTRRLLKLKDRLLSQMVIGLGCCHTEAMVKDLVYIQTHWYESPHGCMGGDQWHPGEGQILCPHCGARLRLYDRPDIVALKRLFKEVKDVHER